MKIYLANDSKQGYGGGWTFLRNLRKALPKVISDNYNEADIYFISGATMLTRENVLQAKKDNKKIVLRIDNIPRNSRNRNTGTTRLWDFAHIADLVVYQSTWAKKYVGGWLRIDGPVIYNGVDTKIFNPTGDKFKKDGNPQYVYVRFNRDETKHWEEAWYHYQFIHRGNPNANLWIIGNFSPEQVEYNFDFYNNEKIKYWGIIEAPEMMATILRSADEILLPYWNDACSNTLLEARASGLRINFLESGNTGGNPELMKLEDISLERMAKEYWREFEKLF